MHQGNTQFPLMLHMLKIYFIWRILCLNRQSYLVDSFFLHSQLHSLHVSICKRHSLQLHLIFLKILVKIILEKRLQKKSYKEFISDPKLVQVIEIGLNNNRDLRTATLNIERVQQQYQITKIASSQPWV